MRDDGRITQQVSASGGSTVYQAARDIHVHAPSDGTAHRVPARNPNFTGRAGLLARLAGARGVLVLRGVGGVGKTQLAVEHAHRVVGDHDVVWWVPAEREPLIPEHLADLGRALGLPDLDDPVATARAALGALHRGRSLLVFDNADDPAALHPYLGYGPDLVLVTTRRAGFDALGEVVDVDVPDRAESVALLRRRVPGIDPGRAADLAGFLGDLPLAVEQAAAYLRVKRTPVGKYLELLRTRTAEVIGRGRVADRDDTLATLWDVSLAAVADQEPAAAHLLDLLARLAPEPVPVGLFTGRPDLLPAPLAEAVADDLAWEDAVGALDDWFLVRRGEEDVTVAHRLLQHALRARPAASPDPHATCQALLLAALDDGGPALLPHALAVCDDPATDVRLLDLTATRLADAGQPGAARPLFERALAAGPERVPLMNKLSRVLFDLRDDEAALALAERTWALCADDPETDRDDRVSALTQLGAARYATGRVDEAFEAFDRALAEVGSARDANGLTSLGGLLLIRNRYAEALPLLEQAVAVTEAAQGPDHPDLVHLLNLLGQALRVLGRQVEARSALERAAAVAEAARGPDHPAVAAQLNALGELLVVLGDPAGAHPLLARALAVVEATYGPDHPSVANVLRNQASAWRVGGHFAEARPLLERALAVSEAAYGPNHPVVAGCLGELGSTLSCTGLFEEAPALLERAVSIVEAAHGPDHPATGAAVGALALNLMIQERYAEALPLLDRAIALEEAAYGPDHPGVATFVGHRAHAYVGLGRFEEARSGYERALAVLEPLFGPDHPDVAVQRKLLARLTGP